ncbi:MAG TPA: hypothetical protein VI756_21025, partial [Blastocatellia bacterium]
LGLLASLLMLAAFFYVSFKSLRRLGTTNSDRRRFHSAVIVASVLGVCAVLVRDLTFSSLLSNKGASLLVWFAMANVANLE